VKIDCLRIIEAGYAPAGSERAWIAAVLEPFEPLARGMGVLAGIVDFGDASPRVGDWIPRGAVSSGLPTGWTRMYDFLAKQHPEVLRALLSPVPSVVCWGQERAACIPGALLPTVMGFLKGQGMTDALGILAAEPSGPSLLVSVPYAERLPVPPRTVRQLARATAHLCSAMRLRRRAAGGTASAADLDADVEAVLAPSGKVLHARGGAAGEAARASLGETVRRIEHARGRLRHTDPEEALTIWRALFDGRWSVIERTESDGKRFMLARLNPPGPPDPKALTQGERDVLACVARGHSNKYAGYLLGVATSTVSTRLESALRKLGVPSRRLAIELLGGAVPSA
jgi:DNA-binding CsgD family transcriptional regulator